MFWNRELLVRYVNQLLRSLTTDIVPASNNVYSLGSSSYRWKDMYFAGTLFGGVGNLSSLQIGGTTVIDSGRVLQNIASIKQSMLPSSDNAYDLGSSSYRWRNMYTVNLYAQYISLD